MPIGTSTYTIVTAGYSLTLPEQYVSQIINQAQNVRLLYPGQTVTILDSSGRVFLVIN
jgi:hypothetical protein